MSKQVFDAIPKLTVKGEALHQLAQGAQGAYETNVLRLAANVVDRETITVGSEVFEIVQINTDTNVNSTAALDTLDAESQETITAHGLAVGAILRVESEYLRVKKVIDANTVVVTRGYAGSTIAEHTAGQDIFKAGATALTAGTVSLPVGGTLTPAAAGPELAAGFAALTKQGFGASYAANGLVIYREHNGSHAACSETLTGVNNAWSAAATYGGIEKGEVKKALGVRVPTATEVALGVLTFYFPFDVTFARVSVFTTSSGAAVAFDGAIAWEDNKVTLTNGTDPDFAATTTVVVDAYGN